MYKNILIGTNTFAQDWLVALKKIKKENIIIYDFSSCNIQNIIKEKNIDFILPLSHKDYLLVKDITGTKILYPANETFNMLDNKLLFTQFMMTYFINYIPKVYYLDNIKLENPEYPIISKPIYSMCGNGMKIYHNEQEFFLCKEKSIIQQFIDDLYEYGAFFLCIDGKIINWKVIKFKYTRFFIKKNTFPKKYQNVPDFPIHLFEPIITKLDYSGGMCINFKFSNKIDIFEINPRFGGSAFSNNFIYELLCIYTPSTTHTTLG